MKKLKRIVYHLFFKNAAAKLYCKELFKYFEDVTAKSPAAVLTFLLNIMSLVLSVSGNYRKNIKNFNAKYVFTDREKFCVVAVFNKNKLKAAIKEPKQQVDDPEFTLIFENSKSFAALLFSESPDVIDALLNQKVDFKGDINYFYKFAYMAKHLQQLGKFLTN